jgi:hypothetical protein
MRKRWAFCRKLPTAELDRLLTGPWTSVRTASTRGLPGCILRLEAMRGGCSGVHLGVRLGGEPASRFDQHATPVTLPDGRQVVAQLDNGGYIHALPTHASAAAVLRNAYLSQAGGNGQRYEIDLSSARVRQATFILDGVRQGQPVGAVLGYTFESNLHEQQLDQFIDNFRAQFPLQSNPSTDTGLPTEAVAARDVVDGLKLRTAFVGGTDVWPLIPPPTLARTRAKPSLTSATTQRGLRQPVGPGDGRVGLSPGAEQYVRSVSRL